MPGCTLSFQASPGAALINVEHNYMQLGDRTQDVWVTHSGMLALWGSLLPPLAARDQRSHDQGQVDVKSLIYKILLTVKT